MKPMKRVGLVAVLVVGVGLLVSTTAWAAKDAMPQITVELRNVGDEPLATGQVTYRGAYFVPEYPDSGSWVTHMSISCRNLTPGATYDTPVGTFTADRRGNGKAAGWATLFETYYRSAFVVRHNADGSRTMVLADPYPG